MNVEIARVLRDDFGLDAQAEMVINGRRPDVLVQRDAGPVIIESEFAPARGVDSDALAKLFLKVAGRSVGVTFALILPRELRYAHESDLPSLLRSLNFKWHAWYSTTDPGPDEEGSLRDLAASVETVSTRATDIDEAVNCLQEGAYAAGETLYHLEGSMAQVAEVFDRAPSEEVANMAALMCINAMMLQDRLSAAKSDMPPMPTHDESRPLVSGEYLRDLSAGWSRIIEIDYKPVFERPLEVLRALPLSESAKFVTECRKTAIDLGNLMSAAGHDLAGQVFNRLVADRKFLAAYYTSIPAATLLAGLALEPDRWDVDWSDIDALKNFTVLDPACGTGTLLMAAYQQILRNHRVAASGGEMASMDELHKVLIEHTIHGSDVVDAAIHMTASTLATMAPKATFDSMNVHVFPLGIDADDDEDAKVGSLEWLDTTSIGSMFTGVADQTPSDSSSSKVEISRPNANLVIANPPFRRHESDTGHGDYKTRVFGHTEEDADELSARLSAMLRGTPANLIAGLASAFVLLAHRTLRSPDRVAMVLPASFLFGTSWQEIRQLFADRYHVEWVVALHSTEVGSLSYDTGIAEAMIVAKKVRYDQAPPRKAKFINLWRRPEHAAESEALLREIRRSPSGIHGIDGPPLGGRELALGTEKWGEIVKAPIGGGPWIGGRWRSSALTQYSRALSTGELWASDCLDVAGQLPVVGLESLSGISPHHRTLRGGQGAFDIRKGWELSDRFAAMWHIESDAQRTMVNDPDSRLTPKSVGTMPEQWRSAGFLHIAGDVRYTSQRIIATKTEVRALGIRSWYSLNLRDVVEERREAAEALMVVWLNSTMGMLLQANHANRSQLGRGTGSRTMLTTLPVLDVRQFSDEKLGAALSIYEDMKDAEFEPLYMCAVDPARIELDERFIWEVSELDPDESNASLADLRLLIAQEPSIHGTKAPALP